MDTRERTKASVNADLAAYLRARPPIDPGKQVLRDSSLWWGITSAAATSLAIFSGADEPVDFLVEADANYARMAQGMIGVANTSFATALIVAGRRQTYTDLRDLQSGVVPPEEIVARADFSQKGALSRMSGWMMNNTHNVAAGVSIVNCMLMMVSGLTSERPGEFMSGMLLIFPYIMRMLPEKYGNEKTEQKKERGWLKKAFEPLADTWAGKAAQKAMAQPPLLLSAMLMAWRILPSFANAVYERDVYLSATYTMAIGMLMFLANSTKDAIGRYGGSIVSADRKNGLEITKALLEGRLLRRQNPAPAPRTP